MIISQYEKKWKALCSQVSKVLVYCQCKFLNQSRFYLWISERDSRPFSFLLQWSTKSCKNLQICTELWNCTLCAMLFLRREHTRKMVTAPPQWQMWNEKELKRSTNQDLFSPQMADSQTAQTVPIFIWWANQIKNKLN